MKELRIKSISYIFDIKNIIENNNFDRQENFSHIRGSSLYDPSISKIANEVYFLDNVFFHLHVNFGIPKEFICQEVKRISSNVRKGSLYFTLEDEILENFINKNIKFEGFKVKSVSVQNCEIEDQNGNVYSMVSLMNKNLMENINNEIEKIIKDKINISTEDKVRNSILELYDKYTNPGPGKSINYTDMGNKISDIINDIFMGPSMGEYPKEKSKQNLSHFIRGFFISSDLFRQK